MSKYDPLWEYIQEQSGQTLLMSFVEIEAVCGLPIDHSFLQYKKELAGYGWQVEKISMKQQTIRFCKIEQETER
ncbi:MAG: hypothetical protein Q4E91_13870 [Lachnospiraceae bacterium]|nr:hypothetical protein [Lachnospiraceae bacterium]